MAEETTNDPYSTGSDLDNPTSNNGLSFGSDRIATPRLYLEDASGNDVTESEDRVKLDKLKLFTSEFNCIGLDSHIGSEFELADNDTFENIIESKSIYDRTANKLDWNPNTTLENGIPYSMRAKHVGSNNGDSNWSNIIIVKRPMQVSDMEFGTFFEGGYYAGIIDTAGVRYAVLVAPKAVGEASSIKWRETRNFTSSATSKWNGLSNTNALDRNSHPVIEFVHSMNVASVNGYGDWYVPAVDELELVFRNLKSSTRSNNYYASDGRPYASSNRRYSGYNPSSDPTGGYYSTSFPVQTSAELFKAGNSEDFKEWAKYWTSTDLSDNYAYAQAMYNGSQSRDYKTNSGGDGYYVRAIRRHIIEL